MHRYPPDVRVDPHVSGPYTISLLWVVTRKQTIDISLNIQKLFSYVCLGFTVVVQS